MKKAILICTSALFSIAVFQQESIAQDVPSAKQKLRHRGDSLSPEQKAKLAEFRKERGQRMSPEKRKELKARYDSLSPEQKKQ